MGIEQAPSQAGHSSRIPLLEQYCVPYPWQHGQPTRVFLLSWPAAEPRAAPATAGAPSTFDAFWFIDYFGCAPPLPPPAVGELDSFGILTVRPYFSSHSSDTFIFKRMALIQASFVYGAVSPPASARFISSRQLSTPMLIAHDEFGPRDGYRTNRCKQQPLGDPVPLSRTALLKLAVLELIR